MSNLAPLSAGLADGALKAGGIVYCKDTETDKIAILKEAVSIMKEDGEIVPGYRFISADNGKGVAVPVSKLERFAYIENVHIVGPR